MLTQKEFKTQKNLPEKKPNHTGIPMRLKTQFETMSGLSFDDVRVHYRSEKPARMQAFAYTQGNNVYVGPGQERYLPHELGHVVQQKLQRIPVTHSIGGMPVNMDSRMERLADSLAQNALRCSDREIPVQEIASPSGQPDQ